MLIKSLKVGKPSLTMIHSRKLLYVCMIGRDQYGTDKARQSFL